jgi:hypothetical protein
MIKLIAIILFLATPVFSADFYVAPSGAGDSSGSSCGNAKAVASLSWASDLGGSDTLHLCSGTYTSTLNVGRNGTSAVAPLTILFESGAQFSKTAWGGTTSAAIVISSRSYITVDGNNVGVIESTANGTAYGTKQEAHGVYTLNSSNIIIKNLEIGPLYIRTEDSSDSNGYGIGIFSNSTSNLTISNNNIYGGYYCIKAAATAAATSGLTINGNNLHEMSTGLVIAADGGGTRSYSTIYVYNNRIYDSHIWDGCWGTCSSGSDWHHRDGIHTWGQSGQPGTVVGPIYFYNNTFDGDWGLSRSTSGYIFVSDYTYPVYIYNNVINTGNGTSMGHLSLHSYTYANAYVYNNTIVGSGTTSGDGYGIYSYGSGSNWTIDAKNNIFYDLYISIWLSAGHSITSDYNDFYNYGSAGRIGDGSWYDTLAEWRVALGGCPGTNNDCNSITSDPVFTSANNLTLQSTSLAKEAGYDLYTNGIVTWTTDILGNTRTAPWSIGAYEYGAGGGGNIYYASPIGGGTACTVATPCTLNTGLSKLIAGDSLYLRSGSYTGGAVTFATNGSSSSRITISGYPGETAIIDGQNTYPDGCYDFLVNISGDYVTIQNLQIKNSYGAGLTLTGDYSNATNIVMDYVGETGIVAQGTGNVIDGCTVSRNGQGYVASRCSYWGSAICSTGTNATIKNSTAYNNRGEGFNSYLGATGTIIQDNISYDNGSVGLYLDSTTYATAQRNLVYYTSSAPYGRASCITVGGETGQPSNLTIINNATLGCRLSLEVDSNVTALTNVEIANNTFANASKTAQDLSDGYNMNVYFRPTINTYSGSTFRNNIVLEEDSNQIPVSVETSHTGLTFSYNNWSKAAIAAAQGTGDRVGDPLLAKGSYVAGTLTGNYFKQSAGSPATNNGVTIASIPTDFFNVARPQGYAYDMGIYELISGADTTPPTVTITGPTSSATYSTTSTTINISGTASDDTGVTSVTWSNNRGGSGSAIGTTSWSQNSIQLYLGSNVLTVRAWDAAGLYSEDTLTVTLTDSTSPTVTIQTSSPQSIASDSLQVSFTSNDNIAVTETRWRIGAQPNGSTGTVCTSPATTSGYNVGANTLWIGARDASGNWGYNSITVNYTPAADGVAPTVTITTTKPAEIVADSMTLTWTDSDNVGVTERRWLIDAQPTASTGTVATSPATVTGIRVGTQTVWVGVRDAAGNWSYDSIQVTRNYGADRKGVVLSGGGSF